MIMLVYFIFKTEKYDCSEFVFDPAKWSRAQMDDDFLKISTMFRATKSVVRVPDLDPRHKIAVLASKQVYLNFIPTVLF